MVGRSAAIDSVIESVTGPARSGCLIVGEMGMGKTALARAVSDVLSPERAVFHVCGTPALSQMAFAVLAPFLGGLETGMEPSQEGVFRAVCGFLRLHRAESKHPPIVVVDDAHDVDPESRTILARMVAADAARIIVLSRRSSIPVEFMELWTDGFLGRCDLDPLSPDDIHALCERVLRGKVLRSVSAMLGDMSKGNPMFVLALLRQSRANGSLFERNGVWLPADVPSPDVQLSERLRRDLMRRPRDEFEVLEAIALAEPIPLDVLTRGGMGLLLDSLESQDLITISNDFPRSVWLANPLFSDVLRRTVPPARSSELRHKYGESAENMPPERLVRHVSWALDCGAPLTDEVLVRAAHAGNGEFDFHFSLQAAAAVQGSAQRDETLLETAIAHAHLGHHVVARDRVEQLLYASDNLPVLLRAVLWICQGSMPAGDPCQHRGLNILLERTAERIGRLRAGGPGDTDTETITALIDVLHHMAEGKSATVEKDLNLIAWHTPAIDIRTRVVSLALLGDQLNAAGRFTAGRTATLLALDLVQKNLTQLRMEFEYVFYLHVKGLLLGGLWDEAAARLADYPRDCSRNLIYSGAALQLFAGTLAVGQGRVYSGLEQLRPAIEGLRVGHHAELLPFGFGVMAYAAALCGDADFVDECVESFPQEGTCGDKGLYLLGEAYSVAAMAVIRRTDDAAQQLADLAGQAKSSGLLAAERHALALAIRIGDAGSADRLAELTSTLDGPISEVLQLYSRAIIASDPDALVEAAASARREGFHLMAVSCVERAVTILDAGADRGRRNEAQVLLRQYRTLLDGPFVLGNYESSRAGRLTPREQEIVELLQSGQSNREVARSLSLSARTVEGHLYRIFAKLGVNSRAELLASGFCHGPQRTDRPRA
ncbi:LuxR C-terminal-related transcriptional regulator [Pseudarthrobacter sulfonivorans]|uniref:LuxR C-terminal-related transcriptional regulator n=1 Tax=Pseudarthrobacter sulfonivorans TaxID=121292 RepID=UPI002861EA7A|nr:LuxR C-terminal-related transcriptional regulator [Pseudarthrobacter sulfonivorans]MDR6414888.1 DNA-binding NarL/FixJ family response regulator [Pseudarthrobacter sulfonivorans]